MAVHGDDLWAHSPGPDGEPQLLADHLESVATLAAEFAGKFGSASYGLWLGWWHDAGKAHADWQSYIRAPEAQARGPDHSSVGMLAALD